MSMQWVEMAEGLGQKDNKLVRLGTSSFNNGIPGR